MTFRRFAQARADGVALDVWRLASYAGGLFVPVKDARGGASTYGGGRYLVDTVKGADLGSGRRQTRARLQLRLQPVVRLRPGLGLPAGAAREPARDGVSRRASGSPFDLVARSRLRP